MPTVLCEEKREVKRRGVVKQARQIKLKHMDMWKRWGIWPIIAKLDILNKTKLLKVRSCRSTIWAGQDGGGFEGKQQKKESLIL